MIKKIVLFTVFAWISLFMGNRAFAQDCDNNPISVTATATNIKSGSTVVATTVSIDWQSPYGFGGTSLLQENFVNNTSGWSTYPTNGNGWKIHPAAAGGFVVASAANVWLISKSFDFSTGGTNYGLSYDILSSKGTHSYEVYVSTNYGGDPTTSTNVKLNPTSTLANVSETEILDLSAYAGEANVHILFLHTATDATDAIELRNINITEDPTLFDIYENNTKIAQVAGTNHFYHIVTATNVAQYCVGEDGCSDLPVCAAYHDPNDASDTWLGVDNNWDNTANWSSTKAPSNVDVTIPGGLQIYPVLTATPSHTFRNIHFKPGAQLEGQQYLSGQYTNAYVQYDLSKRETWQMLSIPLMEAFPGDFTFGGYPQTWVQTFGSNQSGSTTIGAWTTLRQSTTPFSAGDGFVLFLNSDTHTGEPINDGTIGLTSASDILELPYYNNIDGKVHQNITYAAPNETFYLLTNTGTAYSRNTSSTYTVQRSGNSSQLAGLTVSKTLIFANDVIALTGNPYMAALDFKKLSDNNTTVIKPNYYIWEGGSYKAYDATLGATWGIADNSLGQYIAPLQGFLVEKADNANNPVDPLVFSATMASVQDVQLLRSSAVKANTLYIDASNPMATIRTIIAKRDGGQDEFGNMDARKITNGVSNLPEIYTLKPSKGSVVATGVNVINKDDELIPLGLTTNYAGEIKLSFSGMDTYDAAISFIDTKEKTETNLTGLSSFDYTFNNTGTPATCEDRFFFRISKSATGLTEPIADKVNVFESNGLIQVISGTSDPIKEVSVYSLQGALLYRESSLQSVSHTVNRSLPTGAYIVKVISEKTSDNVKVIIK